MSKFWGKADADAEGKPKDEEIEVKAPKEVTEKLAKIDALETSMNEVKNKFSVLDQMGDFLKEQREAKEETRRKDAAAKAAAKAEETDDTWLTDPKKAAQDMLQPLVIDQINTKSRMLAREIFDDGKEFEFYQGDFKQKVDSYIEKLPPSARVEPASIKNCYFLVLGQSQSEIREGKLKSRFAATSTSSAKDSGAREGENAPVTLNDDQKRAADKLGIKHDDYAKNVKELNYV
jgi:hypothetical protein